MTSTPIVTSPASEQCVTKKLATTEPIPWNGWNPMPSIEQFRNLEFEICNESPNSSWTPKAAFDAREAGLVGRFGEYETLSQYLENPDYIDEAAVVLGTHVCLLPKPDELITVYRANDATCGANFGSILPGASVTDSEDYAKRHADFYLNKQSRIMTLEVYPDELVTFGNEGEFIYVPRSLADGHQRFLSDVKNQLSIVRRR